MLEASVNGVAISYQIIGTEGPWIGLVPGGRRGYEELIPLATAVSGRGYRVLLHDRRNCGASEFRIDHVASEYEMLGDDLVGLGKALGIDGMYLGGSSSGARLSLVTAIRHPDFVRGLALWNMTVKGPAALRLADVYYSGYIDAALHGGMAAVCATDHFRELIARRPSNRGQILACDVHEFIAIMEAWRSAFILGAELEVVDATDEQLRALRIPICVVAGNDVQHAPRAAYLLAQRTFDCEVREDVVPRHEPLQASLNREEWKAAEGKLADVVTSFLDRSEQGLRQLAFGGAN